MSSTALTLPPPFLQPLDILATAAPIVFFAELLNSGSGRAKTDLEWVAPVYARSGSTGMLADMVSSLGIVALARKSKDSSMMYVAGQRYSRVLQQSRVALADAVTAVSDEMLTTVWLLALHENIVHQGPRGNASTSAHLEGATKLLLLRANHQFDTVIGQCIFARVLAYIVLECLQNSKPVLPELLQLMQLGRKSNQYLETQVALDLLALTSRLCTLISPEHNVRFPDLRVTHRALVSLDEELAGWPATITSGRCSFSRIESSDPSCPNYYDVYDCHIAAVMMNEYRSIRIHTNEQILRYAQLIAYNSYTTVGDDIATSQDRTMSVLSQMAHEICYSVPYFLNKIVWAKNKLAPGDNDLTLYGGSAIIGPLSLATNEEWVPPKMYRWMLGELERIRECTGIVRTGQHLTSAPSAMLRSSTATQSPLIQRLTAWTDAKEAERPFCKRDDSPLCI